MTIAEGDAGQPVVHRHVAVRTRLVAINAASTVAARILNVTILVWTFQYLLGRLPPAEFAVYPVVMALTILPPFFFSFFTGGINRHTVEAYARGDFEGVTKIISSIFPLLFLCTLAFVMLGLVFAWNIDAVLTIPPDMVASAQAMTALLVIGFAVQLAALPFTAGYHVRQRFVELSVLELGRAVLKLVLLLFLLVAVAPSVVFVVLATVLADLCFTAVTTVRSLGFVPELRVRPSLFSLATARRLVSFGLWTTVGRLAMMLYTTAGTIALNKFGTPTDVVAYYLGMTLFQQLHALIGTALQPLQPALVAMHALDDRERLARATSMAGRYGLWVSMLPASFLLVFAPRITDLLFEPDYAATATVIVLFMTTFVFTQPTGTLPMVAIARGEVRAFNSAALVCTSTGVLLMGCLAWLDAIAAVSVTASLVAITVVPQLAYFWPLHLRLTGLSLRRFVGQVILSGLAPAVAGISLFMALDQCFLLTSWVDLVVAGAVGSLAYVATLLLAMQFVMDRGLMEQTTAAVLARLPRSSIALPTGRD